MFISCLTEGHCYNKGRGITESWKLKDLEGQYMALFPEGDRGVTGQTTRPGSPPRRSLRLVSEQSLMSGLPVSKV